MKWLLVMAIVGSTAASDVLQSFEMKRHGEIRDFRPGALGRVYAALFQRRLLILSVVCMAISFFAFLQLLSITELSFAVPATAATYVVETLLARLLLREQVSAARWAGAAMVAAGVLLLAG